jgi:hypothetical protein
MDIFLKDNVELVRQVFSDFVNIQDSKANVGGIRSINGDRYELFVDENADRGTGVFTWIVREVEKMMTQTDAVISTSRVEEIRKSVMAWANSRALMDKRVSPDVVFQNHALIVSLDKCAQQDVHIDLDGIGHFQFGIICSDQVLGTKEFVPKEPLLGASCNLANIWSDIPKPLSRLIANDKDTKPLLKGFGRLLSIKEDNCEEDPALPLGTLLSLPSGVVHAGPSSDKMRAVLFFSGTPKNQQPYNTEVQHNRTTLLGSIIMFIWVDLQKLNNFAEYRQYLLTKWSEIGLANDKFAINNIQHVHMIKFALGILEAKDKRKQAALIEALASEVWDVNDWVDDEYIYHLPKVNLKKRKVSKLGGQEILLSMSKRKRCVKI